MYGKRRPIMAGVLLGILAFWQTARAQQIVMDANTVTVRAGNTNLLQYRYADVPFKPYIKELRTPSGINVLLDAPPDHLHHHGLMFACAVDNVDFWGEAVGAGESHFEPQPGKQQHRALEQMVVAGPADYRFCRFAELVPWLSVGNEASRILADTVRKLPAAVERRRLLENRTISVGQIGKSKATLLTWSSVLSPPTGGESVVLSGSHYHGLGLRFIRSMDATGEFRNPDNEPGVIFRGEERLVRSRWCAYTAQAEGKLVTVAMFDHPDNPRHPATWFTMAKPFAYMSATLRLHEEPLKLPSGKSLILLYGVALWDGRVDASEIDSLCQKWTSVAGAAWSTRWD